MLNEQELKEIEARCAASKFFTCDDPDFICTFPSDTSDLLAHIRKLEAELAHKERALEWAAGSIVDAYGPTVQGKYILPLNADGYGYPITTEKEIAINAWINTALAAAKANK